jgi:teichoic acid transport system ATP-binding protein
MKDESVTLLFVTHSMSTAKDFCKRGIVLEKGVKLFDGGIDEAIAFYEATPEKRKLMTSGGTVS